MKNNIEIRKIVLFDDNGVTNVENYLTGIEKIMKRTLPKAKTLTISVAETLEVEFYYLNQDKGLCSTLNGTKEVDWFNHLEDVFNDDEIGYLVLCDYNWKKGEFEETNCRIYNHVKQKKNVIFSCYTSISEHAGMWLDSILAEQRECKIIDIVLTMPKDISGRIRSMEEAIQDEW